jgi:pyruvate dehydrogenase E1 component alpha subunit
VGYACSVADICARAAGYDMPGLAVDGNDIEAVRAAAAEAVVRARKGEGPTLLENKTYRIRGHFEGDPQRYRKKEDVAAWQTDEHDPLARIARKLRAKKILTAKAEEAVWAEVAEEIRAAVEFAQQSPYPEPAEALEDLLVNP